MSATSIQRVRVGVIGLGFMGRTHIAAYSAAQNAGYACELVAVADRSAEARTGRAPGAGNLATGSGEMVFDPARVRAYATAEELLADANVDLVSICTHTDTHVPLALAAIKAGKHVLLEKPIAVTAGAIEPLVRAVDSAKTLCMPAMCMRFWPGWTQLKAAMSDGSLGRCTSLMFVRGGSPPPWGTDFYRDTARSGGALVDLHIHDTDFIVHLLGAPGKVVSTGTLHHVTTLYTGFAGAQVPSHVVAEGAWDHSPGFPFRMRYVAVFERGTLDFDLMRTPPLQLHRDGQSETIALDPLMGYDGEVRRAIELITSGQTASGAMMREALAVARTLDAERESLTTGAIVPVKGSR